MQYQIVEGRMDIHPESRPSPVYYAPNAIVLYTGGKGVFLPPPPSPSHKFQ